MLIVAKMRNYYTKVSKFFLRIYHSVNFQKPELNDNAHVAAHISADSDLGIFH
jgi:hypothetical protein